MLLMLNCWRRVRMGAMEASEINEFSKQIQEGGEARMMRVSLLISVLAVLVAMVTVLGHREHTEAILAQARATDTWNEYQARKMRLQQVSIAEDVLTLQPSSDDAAVQAKLRDYRSHTAKWQTELDQTHDRALELEGEVELAERKAARFDLGEALLQISVVLASITLLTRQHRYTLTAMALGLIGLLTAMSTLLVRH
jgi:hypothetical protein